MEERMKERKSVVFLKEGRDVDTVGRKQELGVPVTDKSLI